MSLNLTSKEDEASTLTIVLSNNLNVSIISLIIPLKNALLDN